jgi:tetratricopeptide (TPR) repeat protein
LKKNSFIGLVEIALIAFVVFLNGLLIQTPLPDTWDWKYLDKYSQVIGDVAFLDTYLKHNPDSWEGYYARAEAYEIDGIWTEVKANCDLAISKKNDEPAVYRLRAKAHYALDENEKALADYKYLIDSANANAEDWSHCSMINSRLGRFDQAIADANKALEINHFWATAYQARAIAELELGQFARAAEDAQKATRLYPSFTMPYVIMAAVYNEKGEYKQAIEMCKTALNYDVVCGAAFWQQGVAQNRLRQYDDALSSLNFALSLATNDNLRARAFASRAVSFMHLNKNAEALDDCNAALAIDSAYKPALETKQLLGETPRVPERN